MNYLQELSTTHPSLIGAESAVRLAEALEFDPVIKEVTETPLDDALGKRYVRFGHQVKPDDHGFIFRNEDGSAWQVKRKLGIVGEDGRVGRYLAPRGNGNRAYLPPVSEDVLIKICDRHNLDPIITADKVVEAGGFWAWVQAHPELPIIITEGAKKSLAALSQGHIAIALYGCQCGKSEDLQPYFVEGRQVIAAFDADIKPKAVKAVRKGINILRGAIGRSGAKLYMAQWHPEQGKGIDDVIAESGAEAFDSAIANVIPHAIWQARRSVRYPLRNHKPNVRVNVPCLSAIHPETIPTTGTVVLFAGMGTGKTKLISQLLKNAPGAIAPGHSIGLQRGLGQRLGLDYIDDCDVVPSQGYIFNPEGDLTNRVALCWDSLLKLPPTTFPDGSYDLVLDEIDQGLRHLLRGGTCAKHGKRPGLMKRARKFIQGARRVLCASATLSYWDIELIASLRGEIPWILQNDHQANHFPISLYGGGSRGEDGGTILVRLRTALREGKRALVVTDQRNRCKGFEIWAKKQAQLDDSDILAYHADNSSELEQRAFAHNPDEFLTHSPKRLVVASPSLTSGVSIEGDHFDMVVGLFFAQTITPADAIQQLGRIRQPVERLVWCAEKGRGRPEKWAEAYLETENKRAAAIAHVLNRPIETLKADDPFSAYLGVSGARQNLELADFGAFFKARLEASGYTLTPGTREGIWGVNAAWFFYGQYCDDVRDLEYKDRLNADIISHSEAKSLRNKQALLYKDTCKLERHDIADFYAIPPDKLTLTDVRRDRRGAFRKEIARLEGLLWEGISEQRDQALLQGLQDWRSPILPHDLPTHQLQTEGGKALGVPELIEHCINAEQGWGSSTPWVIEFAERALSHRNDVRVYLGFSLHDRMTACQIVGMVLRSVGIRTQSKRTKEPDGSRPRLYSLVNQDALTVLQGILARRAEKHVEQGIALCPHPHTSTLLRGVDTEGFCSPATQTTHHFESKTRQKEGES